MAKIKRVILYRVLRGSLALFVLISTLCSTSDNHPTHGKTVFEGWERPILSPENIYETECEESDDTLAENIIFSETIENDTLSAPVTEDIFIETEAVTQDETIPKIFISAPTDTKDPEICLYHITVVQWKKSVICGILLILHTEKDGGIYDVKIENTPSEIHFSYNISADKTAVLMDGIIRDGNINTEICFYVLTEKNAGKLTAEVLDYQEIT